MLLIVTFPVSLPAAVGLNWRSSVAVCDGDNVTGVVTPDMEKPVPWMVAPLMVTAAVPLEVRVTVWVDGVLRATLPKATLLEPRVRAGVPLEVGFNCREKLWVPLLEEAVRVAVCADVTADAVTVNPALDEPEGTVTEAGT